MHYARNVTRALFVACLLALLSTMPLAQETSESPQSEIAKLISVLTSDANVFDKAMACRRLSVIGDESAVPALSGLLADEQLGTYARAALEVIPSPDASTALREAIPRLRGNLLVGVLSSIGVRRDPAALDAVAALLHSGDEAVAAAATQTLGHIGTPAAAEVLQKALSVVASELRPAVGQACLTCVQHLARQGERDKAVALCDAVRNADVPEHIRLAATYNAILVLGKDGLPRLVEQLNSDMESEFRLALRAARQLDVDTSAELVAQFARHPPQHQALLLMALSDLGNKASLPTVLEAARNGDPDVRVQAIRGLARLGDATVVPILLEAAADSHTAVADAARAALAALEGDPIDAAVVEMLGREDSPPVLAAIEIASQRNIAGATPALLRLTHGDMTTTRTAAIRALGHTATLEHLRELIELTIETTNSEDAAIAQKALKSACARMPQADCAESLATAISNSPQAVKVILLEPLVVVGGTKALQTVVAAAKCNDDAIQDAATRLLGGWLTVDAAPVMLDLSKTLASRKYRIRALRGYIRIARQLNMTTDQRMEVCRNALGMADRSEEKELVLEVLRRYPTPDGLKMAKPMLNDEQLKVIAQSTVNSITRALDTPNPDHIVPPPAIDLNMTTDQRVAACRDTLMFSQSDEERLQAFETLRRYPAPGGLALAVTLLSHGMYEPQACATIVSLADSLGVKDPAETEKALLQVLDLTTDSALRPAAEEKLAMVREFARQRQAEADFTLLFDGLTIEGWNGNKEFWRVENGEIVGGSLKEMLQHNEFLRTAKEYTDFELRLQFKLLGENANAGVQFRTQEIPNQDEVRGYQADLGPGLWGCLYDESRRNRILAGLPTEQRATLVRAGDWNHYRIRCEGRRIQLWINDAPSVDYTEQDPAIPQKGIIALQVHGNLTMEARYRNLRIKEL